MAILDPEDVVVPGPVGERMPVTSVDRTLTEYGARAKFHVDDVRAARVGTLCRGLIAVPHPPTHQLNDGSEPHAVGFVHREARANAVEKNGPCKVAVSVGWHRGR